jgi:hypothetical protein
MSCLSSLYRRKGTENKASVRGSSPYMKKAIFVTTKAFLNKPKFEHLK